MFPLHWLPWTGSSQDDGSSGGICPRKDLLEIVGPQGTPGDSPNASPWWLQGTRLLLLLVLGVAAIFYAFYAQICGSQIDPTAEDAQKPRRLGKHAISPRACDFGARSPPSQNTGNTRRVSFLPGKSRTQPIQSTASLPLLMYVTNSAAFKANQVREAARMQPPPPQHCHLTRPPNPESRVVPA